MLAFITFGLDVDVLVGVNANFIGVQPFSSDSTPSAQIVGNCLCNNKQQIVVTLNYIDVLNNCTILTTICALSVLLIFDVFALLRNN